MKKLLLGISILGLLVMPIISSNAFTAKAATLEVPDWVANSKVKGDFRGRYQMDDQERSLSTDRDRERLRYRLRVGVETMPNDQWTVGFGVASGDDEAGNSTNETLGDSFAKDDFWLDYAYAQYQPIEPVKLIIGKFGNPIWGPKDLIWDGDINPEGIAAPLNFKASENVSIFLTPAYYIFNETSWTDDDVTIMALQAGIEAKMSEAAHLKFAGTYYSGNNIFGTDVDADAWALDAEAGFTGMPVFLAVFGQYVSHDPDDGAGFGDDNTAYLFGFKAGDKKVKEAGDWQIKYNYRKLECDSWVNTGLGDSDFLGGDTAGDGSEIELIVGIAKNVNLSLDYYTGESDDNTLEEDVIQFDVNVKFP